MSTSGCLSTAEMLAVFTDEIAARGGEVRDTFHDGSRLFTRSVLPRDCEVGPKDRVQGGVALKSDGREAWLHPYVFRLVCRNGAIMAHAVQTCHLPNFDLHDADDAGALLRDAIRACCTEEAFTAAAEQMRSAREIQADAALNLLPLLSHFRGRGPALMGAILERFFGEGDRTRFGLMNAVTSLARDTRDPDLRWRLEELGGGVPALVAPRPFPRKPGTVAPQLPAEDLALEDLGLVPVGQVARR
jgi:hypothetical protein